MGLAFLEVGVALQFFQDFVSSANDGFGNAGNLVFKCPKCGGTAFHYYTERDLFFLRRRVRNAEGIGAVRV